MPNLTQLRLAAREIFDEMLRAVDAGAAVRRAVRLDRSRLHVCDLALGVEGRKIYSVAIGKAAFPMASALEQTLGDAFTAGLMSCSPTLAKNNEIEQWKTKTRWRWREGGHPLPNLASWLAANQTFELLGRANEERAVIVFLISGGGSAMIESPLDDEITVEDLRAANKTLINCGASISEVNAVRRGFSAIKGGRLAMLAPTCDQITLIVSDVPRGEEWNVASGPTLMPPPEAPHALEVIERYDLRTQLPEAILRTIERDRGRPENKPGSLRRHFVLLDNRNALEAAATAAEQRGFVTEIAADISDQSIEEGCRQLLARVRDLRDQANSKTSSRTKPICLISGGEFACPVRGEGLGGRNSETALRLATQQGPTNLANSANFVAICAGTDGIDGNSPAAGAIIDSSTIERARGIGLDPADFIERSNAYSFFVALGDAISTGPTGTNVRDVRILLYDR